jgi:hypothetical protein
MERRDLRAIKASRDHEVSTARREHAAHKAPTAQMAW